jgi:hypothetical protein
VVWGGQGGWGPQNFQQAFSKGARGVPTKEVPGVVVEVARSRTQRLAAEAAGTAGWRRHLDVAAQAHGFIGGVPEHAVVAEDFRSQVAGDEVLPLPQVACQDVLQRRHAKLSMTAAHRRSQLQACRLQGGGPPRQPKAARPERQRREAASDQMVGRARTALLRRLLAAAKCNLPSLVLG